MGNAEFGKLKTEGKKIATPENFITFSAIVTVIFVALNFSVNI